MANKSLIRPVAIAAAVVGTIECLLWCTGACLSVAIYKKSLTAVPEDETIKSLLMLFFTGPYISNSTVSPKVFNIFMCIYIAISFVGLVFSLIVLWGMFRVKWKNQWKFFSGWAATMIATSILDVTLLGMVAADFDKNRAIFDISESWAARLAVIVVMIFASRGILLWIANVVFAAILLKFAIQLQKEDEDDEPRRTVIDAFGTGSTPSPFDNYLYENAKTLEFTNKGYRDDEVDNSFYRSQSFYNMTDVHPKTPPAVPPKENGPPTPNKITMGRFAKIGKLQQPGRMTPPTNVQPPFIPPPDYSPPASPNAVRKKPVLKSTSNYAMY